jgi:hypothetical protein
MLEIKMGEKSEMNKELGFISLQRWLLRKTGFKVTWRVALQVDLKCCLTI